MSPHYDVIIIGTGAGGGTLARKLAPSGKSILLLERGDYLPREEENWSSREAFVTARYHTRETWFDKKGTPFHPHAHFGVGGNTKLYGAVLFRLRERDFGEIIHYGGVSPAWPLSYNDFEPYYAEAERLYFVHGQRGEDPTEPPASGPFPHPAVSHEPRIQQLHDDLVRTGHEPFHLPVGIMLDEVDREASPCVRCAYCDGFPCLVDAKSDAHVVGIRPALSHDNVTLMRNAKVEHLETDASGTTITGVVVNVDGERVTYAGDIVVVSCGAANSAALLLASANDAHPRGLANSSDQVGRNYMCHINSAVLAISKDRNATVFQKTLGLNDYYSGSDDFDYPLGHIQMLRKTDGPMLKDGAPPLAPTFAIDWVSRRAIDFWVTSEDLPNPDNRVTVDRDGRITIAYNDANTEGHRRLLAKIKGLLKELDCHRPLLPNHLVRDGRIPLAGVAHQCGTVRFGADPSTSVLDVNCKAHDVDNLYVVDTSFFPSSAAVNPALTAMANALRVGDHLLDRLGAPSSARELVRS